MLLYKKKLPKIKHNKTKADVNFPPCFPGQKSLIKHPRRMIHWLPAVKPSGSCPSDIKLPLFDAEPLKELHREIIPFSDLLQGVHFHSTISTYREHKLLEEWGQAKKIIMAANKCYSESE